MAGQESPLEIPLNCLKKLGSGGGGGLKFRDGRVT